MTTEPEKMEESQKRKNEQDEDGLRRDFAEGVRRRVKEDKGVAQPSMDASAVEGPAEERFWEEVHNKDTETG